MNKYFYTKMTKYLLVQYYCVSDSSNKTVKKIQIVESAIDIITFTVFQMNKAPDRFKVNL